MKRDPEHEHLPPEPWVTKRQLADHLSVTPRWIELQHPLGLPRLSTGGMTRYRISEIEAWLRERYGSPAETPEPRRPPERYGPSSTVHGWFQRFSADGFLEELWAYLVRECDELGEVHWEWQAVDGVMGRSRFGGEKTGPNPTDRAKMGTKKSVQVEQHGGPLAVEIDGANVHDTKLLERTIDAVIVPRPDPADVVEHLCLDKGYDNPTGQAATTKGGYVPHIRRIGEEKKDGWGEKTWSALAATRFLT